MTTLIVVGAGYAGLMAANRAARRLQVTLVSDQPFFVDRIRLHEVVAGTRSYEDALRPLSDSVDPRVTVVVGRATAVRTGVVTLADGRQLTADHVLLAVGSGAGNGSAAWAATHRDAVAGLAAGATVAVVGAGFTGLETATEVAERRPDLRVWLIDRDDPYAPFPPAGKRHLEAVLTRLSIQVLTELPSADHVIDCTGFTVPPLARDSGLPVDASGHLLLEPTLQVPGHPGLWGAGDAVRVPRLPHLRDACATAEPMAAFAADQIGRVDRGEELHSLCHGYAAWCLSLGRRDALVTFVSRDDRPTGRVMRGRTAALGKELICRAAAYAPRGLARWYRELPGPGPVEVDVASLQGVRA